MHGSRKKGVLREQLFGTVNGDRRQGYGSRRDERAPSSVEHLNLGVGVAALQQYPSRVTLGINEHEI
jgi:hypothetical protein